MVGSVASGVIYAANASAKPESASSIAAGKVSLNKSDAKSLMQIKGMSAYKAHAIVTYRKQNGDFKTIADLSKVKGFKRMKPESIKSISDQMLLD
jgi:competence protein ComEA